VKLPTIFSSSNPIYQKDKHNLKDLSELEQMHHSKVIIIDNFNFQVLDLYLWLGQKYPEAFKEIEKARESKKIICEMIEKILEEVEPIK